MPKQLTEEQKKELAILKASAEMLEKTKRECKLRKSITSINLIDGIEDDLKTQVSNSGADVTDLTNISYKEPEQMISLENKNDSIKIIANNDIKPEPIIEPINDKYNFSIDDIDTDVQYDVLPLPSKGEPYTHKKGRIPVSYLTASDENIITSPNLYRDGTILDVLLRRKIMDKDINPDLLCKGDRDAIILWLRATGYGPEFPIVVTDPKTKKEFETEINLGEIKTNEFNLKGDANGFFDFITPFSKDLIKFKFFNRIDEKTLATMEKNDSKNAIRDNLEKIIEELREQLMEVDNLSNSDRLKIIAAIDTIENWSNNIPKVGKSPYNKTITNSMELAIMSINDNTDRELIKRYVQKMPVLDAFKFRKYMNENEPSLNFKIHVKRPESLGGGSFETFLETNNSIFLNISKL